MKFEIRCPDCNRLLLAVDFSAAPFMKKARRVAEANKARKFLAEARRCGIRVKATKAERVKVDKSELWPHADRCKASWEKFVRAGAMVGCRPCGTVLSLDPDSSEPMGVKARRAQKPEDKPEEHDREPLGFVFGRSR